jgi:outer membrane autotransporter protein
VFIASHRIITPALALVRRWRQPLQAGIGAVALLLLGLTEPALAGCGVTPSGNALNNLANADTANCADTTISQTGNLLTAIGNSGAPTFNTINLTNTQIDLTSDGIATGVHSGNGSGITLNQSAININGTIPGTFLVGINGANGNVVHLNDSTININAPGAGSIAEGIQATTSSEITLTNSQIDATGVLAGVGITGSGLNVVVDNSTINGSSQSVNLAASTLVLNTGAHLNSVSGADGSGNSLLGLAGSGSEDEVFGGFGLLVQGDWSLSGASNFVGINVTFGRLAINGPITSSFPTTVQSDGILGGNGTLTSTVNGFGILAPGNSVGTLGIVGNLTQTDGSFEAQFDQHGIDRLNVTGTTTLVGTPVVNVIPLGGSTGGSGIILASTGGITGSFAAVNFDGNGAATLIQSATDIRLITLDGTVIEANDFAATQAGLDFLDAVSSEQIAGLANCDGSCATTDNPDRAHAWMKGFGRFGSEDANAGNRPFTYDTAGSALGGDVAIAKGLRLGGSFGYSYSDVDLTDHGSNTGINSTLAAVYASYQNGRFFATASAGGGWQGYDISRQVTVDGIKDQANATTDGFLANANLQGGLQLRFPGNWLLVPSVGVSYQHQWVDGYQEHGASSADVSVDSHQSDALRLKSQLWLGRAVDFTDLTLTPHLSIGVAQQFAFGGKAGGSFSTGGDFDIALNDRDRTIGLIGLGIDAAFSNGLTTYLAYDGQFAAEGHVHAVTAGLRYSW